MARTKYQRFFCGVGTQPTLRRRTTPGIEKEDPTPTKRSLTPSLPRRQVTQDQGIIHEALFIRAPIFQTSYELRTAIEGFAYGWVGTRIHVRYNTDSLYVGFVEFGVGATNLHLKGLP